MPDSVVEQLKLAHVSMAETPLVEWACENLVQIAAGQRNLLGKLEKSTMHDRTEFIELVSRLDHDSLKTFQQRMTTLKANSRFQAKTQWHEYQFKLQTRISEALSMEHGALADDVDILQEVRMN